MSHGITTESSTYLWSFPRIKMTEAIPRDYNRLPKKIFLKKISGQKKFQEILRKLSVNNLKTGLSWHSFLAGVKLRNVHLNLKELARLCGLSQFHNF